MSLTKKSSLIFIVVDIRCNVPSFSEWYASMLKNLKVALKEFANTKVQLSGLDCKDDQLLFSLIALTNNSVDVILKPQHLVLQAFHKSIDRLNFSVCLNSNVDNEEDERGLLPFGLVIKYVSQTKNKSGFSGVNFKICYFTPNSLPFKSERMKELPKELLENDIQLELYLVGSRVGLHPMSSRDSFPDLAMLFGSWHNCKLERVDNNPYSITLLFKRWISNFANQSLPLITLTLPTNTNNNNNNNSPLNSFQKLTTQESTYSNLNEASTLAEDGNSLSLWHTVKCRPRFHSITSYSTSSLHFTEVCHCHQKPVIQIGSESDSDSLPSKAEPKILCGVNGVCLNKQDKSSGLMVGLCSLPAPSSLPLLNNSNSNVQLQVVQAVLLNTLDEAFVCGNPFSLVALCDDEEIGILSEDSLSKEMEASSVVEVEKFSAFCKWLSKSDKGDQIGLIAVSHYDFESRRSTHFRHHYILFPPTPVENHTRTSCSILIKKIIPTEDALYYPPSTLFNTVPETVTKNMESTLSQIQVAKFSPLDWLNGSHAFIEQGLSLSNEQNLLETLANNNNGINLIPSTPTTFQTTISASTPLVSSTPLSTPQITNANININGRNSFSQPPPKLSKTAPQKRNPTFQRITSIPTNTTQTSNTSNNSNNNNSNNISQQSSVGRGRGSNNNNNNSVNHL